MFPPSVAAGLRALGHEGISSVIERSDLRGRPDEELFAVAQLEQRAFVTEDAADLTPIAHDWIRSGRTHFGIVFTSNRRFPRAQPDTVGRLIRFLAALLDAEASIDAS